MSYLGQIWNFALGLFDNIWSLYTANLILASSIALFVLGKLINIIRRVLPHG